MNADPPAGKPQPQNERAPALPTLHRLMPPGPDTDPEDFVASLKLDEARPPRTRPRVLLNMASSADGRASLGGRSGGLGNRADKLLFHALRAAVDAVMMGAGTVRAERYGRMIRDPERRRARAERGRAEEPLACVVSARLELPADVPLLSDPDAHVVILTPSAESLEGVRARVEYVRAGSGATLDLARALAELHERFAVRTLLCEGGPHLNHDLLRAGLVDELYLSLAPLLAGGDDPERRTLRIVAGEELPEPAALQLASVLESKSQLFLRYLARASEEAASGEAPSDEEAVSAETTRSRSLASADASESTSGRAAI
jgi:riboflavin-specific deaminase-like protein